MSNLSDLLPAGAGAKSATFTASGTLATGTTVALQSDGTVKAISATGTSYTETLGSDTSIANVNSSQFSAAYHVAGDKIIVGYRNVTDVNGYYVVGTISGSTITFTSPISFSATNTTDVNVTYHEAAQVVVFSYKNGFNDGVARAASLSGTTLTFGTEVAFTTNTTDYTSATYDSDQEKIVVCYSDSTNSDYLTGVALSVSGTAITAGTPVVLESQFAAYISVEYHRANTVHVVAYKNQTSGDMRGRGFTVSGTTVTNGNQTLVANGDGRPGSPRGLTYYPEIEKLLLVYQDPTNDYGRIIPLNATTSGGGTVTKGTEEYFTSAAITDAENSLAIEPFTAASKLVITYKNSGDSFLVSVSVDASENITVDTPITLQSGSGGSEQQTLGYDSVAAQMVVAYADKTNSNYATANLYNPAYSATNSADFVGITDEAIANTATGSVVVEGGVTEKVSSLTTGSTYYVLSDGTLADAARKTYDISGASYTSKSFSVSSQESNPNGIAFNTDGTKMLVVGSGGDDVNEYALSTAFDVTTASFTDSFSVATQATTPNGLTFNTDGTAMYVADANTDTIYQYTLTTGFDVSTASYASKSTSISSQDTDPEAVAFNSDGTKMFLLGDQNKKVYEYTVSTGFDLGSTVTYVRDFSVNSQETGPRGLTFNSDGTKMFVVGYQSDTVYQYNLTTGFDLSTASYASISFSVSSEASVPQGITFNATGNNFYVIGSGAVSVFQYDTTTDSGAITVGKALSTNKLLLKG